MPVSDWITADWGTAGLQGPPGLGLRHSYHSPVKRKRDADRAYSHFSSKSPAVGHAECDADISEEPVKPSRCPMSAGIARVTRLLASLGSIGLHSDYLAGEASGKQPPPSGERQRGLLPLPPLQRLPFNIMADLLAYDQEVLCQFVNARI